jgi:hypothetical protein
MFPGELGSPPYLAERALNRAFPLDRGHKRIARLIAAIGRELFDAPPRDVVLRLRRQGAGEDR